MRRNKILLFQKLLWKSEPIRNEEKKANSVCSTAVYSATALHCRQACLLSSSAAHSIACKGQSFSEWTYEVIVSPKIRTKIVRISALCSEGRNLDNCWFVFWKKQWIHKFIFINSFSNCLTFRIFFLTEGPNNFGNKIP